MNSLLMVIALAGTAGEAEASSASRTADSTWRDRAVWVRMSREPEPVLEWDLIVPASIEDVWNAWTDQDELPTWAAPAAAIDLRVGGHWEAHFNPDRPAGQRGSDANEILAFDPLKSLTIHAGAPPRFPTVREEGTLFVVRLEPVGHGHTRVVARQTGWKTGEEWDAAFNYLASANAEWLNWLQQRFVYGPIDWSIGPGMVPGR